MTVTQKCLDLSLPIVSWNLNAIALAPLLSAAAFSTIDRLNIRVAPRILYKSSKVAQQRRHVVFQIFEHGKAFRAMSFTYG